MTILIDNRSGQPIYEQIFEQLRAQIFSGAVAAEEALPSIRSLAKDLRISVITTKRAYEELESAGLIVTVPGKGSFAAPAERRAAAGGASARAGGAPARGDELAAECGLSREKLHEILERMEET